MDEFLEDQMWNQVLEVENGGGDFDDPMPESLVPVLSRFPDMEHDVDDFKRFCAEHTIRSQCLSGSSSGARFSSPKRVTGRVFCTSFSKNKDGKDRIEIVLNDMDTGKDMELRSVKLCDKLKGLKPNQVVTASYLESDDGRFKNIVAAEVVDDDPKFTIDRKEFTDKEAILSVLSFEKCKRMLKKMSVSGTKIESMTDDELDRAINKLNQELGDDE